jgi:hypothetical protein
MELCCDLSFEIYVGLVCSQMRHCGDEFEADKITEAIWLSCLIGTAIWRGGLGTDHTPKPLKFPLLDLLTAPGAKATVLIRKAMGPKMMRPLLNHLLLFPDWCMIRRIS